MKLWEICTLIDVLMEWKKKKKVINKFKHISASKLKEYQNDVSGEVRLLSTEILRVIQNITNKIRT